MESALSVALSSAAALVGIAATYGLMKARLEVLQAEVQRMRADTIPELEKRLRAAERSLAKFSGPHISA